MFLRLLCCYEGKGWKWRCSFFLPLVITGNVNSVLHKKDELETLVKTQKGDIFHIIAIQLVKFSMKFMLGYRLNILRIMSGKFSHVSVMFP